MGIAPSLYLVKQFIQSRVITEDAEIRPFLFKSCITRNYIAARSLYICCGHFHT